MLLALIVKVILIIGEMDSNLIEEMDSNLIEEMDS